MPGIRRTTAAGQSSGRPDSRCRPRTRCTSIDSRLHTSTRPMDRSMGSCPAPARSGRTTEEEARRSRIPDWLRSTRRCHTLLWFGIGGAGHRPNCNEHWPTPPRSPPRARCRSFRWVEESRGTSSPRCRRCRQSPTPLPFQPRRPLPLRRCRCPNPRNHPRFPRRWSLRTRRNRRQGRAQSPAVRDHDGFPVRSSCTPHAARLNPPTPTGQ